MIPAKKRIPPPNNNAVMGRCTFNPAIDAGALDQEWLQQPALRHRWSGYLADAKRDLSELQRQAKVRRAELGMAIRLTPSDFDLEKTTKDAVDDCIEIQPSTQEDEKAIIEAEHAVQVLVGVLAAISDRKTTLENMVELFLADYYAAPHARTQAARNHMDESGKQDTRRRGQRMRPDGSGD